MNYAKAYLLAIVGLLAPIHAILISTILLILVDAVTGVWAAIKHKEEISSAKLRNTVSKLVIYYIAIISGFVVEKYMHLDIIPVIQLTAAAIGLVELKSIFENINKISGVDFLKELVRKLGSSNLPPK